MKSISELDSMAIMLRKEFGEDAVSPIDIFSIAYSIEDLTTVLYPLGSNISGMCIKGKGANLIAINSEMSVGRQRFSLAHEFYHLYYDSNKGKSISGKSFSDTDEKEIEADIFASHFLLPSIALYSHIGVCDCVSAEQVVKLEQVYGMSRKAILYRLQEDDKITEQMVENLQTNVQYLAASLGYDTKLYKSTPQDQNARTMGQYIRIANELYTKELISTGKYEQFLLEAFREDLVYGNDDEEDGNID